MGREFCTKCNVVYQVEVAIGERGRIYANYVYFRYFLVKEFVGIYYTYVRCVGPVFLRRFSGNGHWEWNIVLFPTTIVSDSKIAATVY